MALSAHDDGYRLYYPEPGGVKSLLGFLLLYHLVALATPVLSTELRQAFPKLAPEPLTTFMAILLWAGAGVTAVTFVSSSRPIRIYKFDTDASLREHLNDNRPGRKQVALYALVAGGGALLSWFTYSDFREAFVNLNQLFVIWTTKQNLGFGITDALWLFAFVGGYVLFASGIDKLLVSGLRVHLSHRYTDGS